MIPRCPACAQRLFQLDPKGPKLRTRIVIFNVHGGPATIKCPACKADVQCDIQLGAALKKELAEAPPRLLVRQ
jgi:NAD-dependent SIR2 family protein deacetylase